MRIVVTGGTGFVGNYIVQELLEQGNELIVTGTNESKARGFSWFNNVEFVELKIGDNIRDDKFEQLLTGEKLIHLAWEGLPHYKELFHFEEILLPQYFFLKRLIESGLNDITITGTCLEYGMKNGCLEANMITDPQNSYAIAKDSLRKFLGQLQSYKKFDLKWVRVFYMYGNGQSDHSLLKQLENAVHNQQEVFNMSGGEQLRDYLHVKEVATKVIEISQMSHVSGIFNCCSGKPISIRTLVEKHKSSLGSDIKLNLGYYPYLDFEPFAFWGNTEKS